MASPPTTTITTAQAATPPLRLTLAPPADDRHVTFAPGTFDRLPSARPSVDCCAYQKPRKWDESESESDEDEKCCEADKNLPPRRKIRLVIKQKKSEGSSKPQ